MYNGYITRLDLLIKHRNAVEESQNTSIKDFIIFSCLNKRQISGPTDLHDAMVDIVPFSASFEPELEQIENDRFTVNEAAEFENLVKSWISSSEDNKISKKLILSDLMIRYLFNRKEDENEKMSEKGLWDQMLQSDPCNFRK